jgi:hypothetical protein
MLIHTGKLPELLNFSLYQRLLLTMMHLVVPEEVKGAPPLPLVVFLQASVMAKYKQ